MKVLQDGQLESYTHHRCRQTQCSFFVNGGCRACEDCGSEPYEIENACDRCFACENIPDALRWGDKNHAAMQQAKEQNKNKLVIAR